MASTIITSFDDTINVCDVIARVEELEDVESPDEDNIEELETLTKLLDDLVGNGGDEQWRGDWYPSTLIRDTYFKTYAMELADDTSDAADNPVWPFTCIDWDKAARELRVDYTSVEFGTMTYWFC